MVLDLFQGIDFNYWFVKSLVALGLIIIGFVLGKLFENGLIKLVHKLELGKKMKESFIMLSIMIFTWCIYLVFINLALFYLNIPLLEKYVIGFLLIIPAFVGALVLIAIGFAIAIYLREIIEDSETTGWKFLSKFMFYFIIYVIGVYALRLALVAMDSQVVHWIILVLTAIIALAVSYVVAKKELKTD